MVQYERYLELAASGAAIGLLNEDVQARIAGLNCGLREISRLLAEGQAGNAPAQSIDGIAQILTTLQENFEYLEKFTAMLLPLDRQLYKKPKKNTGADIHSYLEQFFGQDLESFGIQFRKTEAFDEHSITAYPVTYLPTFINIMNISIYWLKKLPEGQERIITLDADDKSFLVGNNGPEIPEEFIPQLFDVGFLTREKSDFGLFFAKRILQSNGFDIALHSAKPPVLAICTVPH